MDGNGPYIEPIDLGQTRLADKLQGAVSPNIASIATEALNSYVNNNLRLVGIVGSETPTYEKPKCTTCTVGRVLVLLAVGFVALTLIGRA